MKINYKSDFDFILPLRDAEGNDLGWPDFDWELLLSTSGAKTYRVGCVNGNCFNCYNDEGRIHVVLDRHGFVPGQLKGTLLCNPENTVYYDGHQLTAIPFDLDITLVDAPSDIAEIDAEVLTPYALITAYDLAVHNGYTGTKEAFYSTLADIVDGEASRAAAEAERASAEGARQAAETARAQAEQLRVAAEQARVQAEQARVEAESLRAQAEAQRKADETARAQAEGGRANAESGRVTAENARAQSETARAQAESQRDTAEGARATAEGQRQSAEAARSTAESDRVTAESSRLSAESQRVATESERATAETERKQAESARAAAEQDRATVESGRDAAESLRASAEASRVSAESQRVNAEGGRQSAESTRATNETQRVNAESARATQWTALSTDAADATDAANAAAERAEAIADGIDEAVGSRLRYVGDYHWGEVYKRNDLLKGYDGRTYVVAVDETPYDSVPDPTNTDYEMIADDGYYDIVDWANREFEGQNGAYIKLRAGAQPLEEGLPSAKPHRDTWVWVPLTNDSTKMETLYQGEDVVECAYARRGAIGSLLHNMTGLRRIDFSALHNTKSTLYQWAWTLANTGLRGFFLKDTDIGVCNMMNFLKDARDLECVVLDNCYGPFLGDRVFAECPSLKYVRFDVAYTSLEFSRTFINDNALERIDFVSVPRASKMHQLFYGCSSLTELDLSVFDASECTLFDRIFGLCTALRFVRLNPTFFVGTATLSFLPSPMRNADDTDNGWLAHLVEVTPTITDGEARTIALASGLKSQAWAAQYIAQLQEKGYTIA